MQTMAFVYLDFCFGPFFPKIKIKLLVKVAINPELRLYTKRNRY